MLQQGIIQTKYYIGHMRINDTAGKLMSIENDYVELITGLGKYPLHHPAITSVTWCPQLWITHVGKFLRLANHTIQTQTPRVVKHQQDNDLFLMSVVGHLGKNTKCIFKRAVYT